MCASADGDPPQDKKSKPSTPSMEDSAKDSNQVDAKVVTPLRDQENQMTNEYLLETERGGDNVTRQLKRKASKNENAHGKFS